MLLGLVHRVLEDRGDSQSTGQLLQGRESDTYGAGWSIADMVVIMLALVLYPLSTVSLRIYDTGDKNERSMWRPSQPDPILDHSTCEQSSEDLQCIRSNSS